MDLIAETTKPPTKSPVTKSVEINLNDPETIDPENSVKEEQSSYTKIEEIDLLSSIGRDIGVDLEKYVQSVPDVVAMETIDVHSNNSSGLVKETIINDDTNKFIDDVTKIDTTTSNIIDCRKNEKMARNQARRRQQSHSNQRRTDNNNKRRSDNVDKISSGSFDVYNIETAMPKIDLDVIESHLRAAHEEERRVSKFFFFLQFSFHIVYTYIYIFFFLMDENRSLTLLREHVPDIQVQIFFFF